MEGKPPLLGPPRSGLLHKYTSRLTAFEHNPKPTETPPQNLLLFIGGLFDGLLTTTYTTFLAESLPKDWSLAQPLLSSSYLGFGTSSIAKDVSELSRCVTYFRGIKPGKIVIMGHSTGCQDVMEYLTGPGHDNRQPIDGGILQAPVSDREAIVSTMDKQKYKSSCSHAANMIEAGLGDEVIPSDVTDNFFKVAVTAKRWLSLASPDKNGDDDYFSSDLPDDRLLTSFGALPERSPLCILISGADEYIPPTINKEALLANWLAVVKKGKGRVDEEHSGILAHASHNLGDSSEEVVAGLVSRVVGFLEGLSPHPNL